MNLTHWNKFKYYWVVVGKLLYKKQVFFNASAITFNLFICAIPFTLILISILGYILSFDAAFDELLRYGRELFPTLSYKNQSGDIIEGAITLEELLQPLIGARQIFGISGLIILIFFAQGLFHTLKHVLFMVFDIKDRKSPTMEFVYNFFTFGIIGGVFIFFTMAISLISIFSFENYPIPYTDIVIELEWISEWLTGFIPLLFTFVLFYAIFRFISERRMNVKVSLVAAATYTLLFALGKNLMSFYLQYAFEAYQFFYQGYAALTVISFWAFYTATLFVITTILAKAFRDVYMKDAIKTDQNPYTEIS
ncbi:MAG: YihY/virulence factor BrkB family protein [Balneolaceae bacterium]